MPIDIIALIIAILCLLVVVFLIPTLLQIKTTTQRLDEFLREAERELVPTLRNLRETSVHLERVMDKAEKGVDEASGLMESLGEVGDSIGKFNDMIHHGLGRSTGNALGLWLGVRTASKVFLKQLKQNQKGGE